MPLTDTPLNKLPAITLPVPVVKLPTKLLCAAASKPTPAPPLPTLAAPAALTPM